ncbi:MAG: hypothetical protein KM310_06850 [Clostridiales bacterium]|nr:hypothetical protein [Clostridiales bacterium]
MMAVVDFVSFCPAELRRALKSDLLADLLYELMLHGVQEDPVVAETIAHFLVRSGVCRLRLDEEGFFRLEIVQPEVVKK